MHTSLRERLIAFGLVVFRDRFMSTDCGNFSEAAAVQVQGGRFLRKPLAQTKHWPWPDGRVGIPVRLASGPLHLQFL